MDSETLLPLCVAVMRSQKMWLPLPLLMYCAFGQLVADVIFSAHVPVRSQDALQIPELQIGVPPVTAGQVLPQLPQFEVELSCVSQPFGRLLSQSPQPVPQLGTHADEVQLVVPCAFVQAVPHAPQLFRLVRRLTSQPLAGALSQFA